METETEKSPDGVKYYRLSEVEEHKSVKSTWIIINFKVYDVTKFLEEVRTKHSRFHHRLSDYTLFPEDNQTNFFLFWVTRLCEEEKAEFRGFAGKEGKKTSLTRCSSGRWLSVLEMSERPGLTCVLHQFRLHQSSISMFLLSLTAALNQLKWHLFLKHIFELPQLTKVL